MSNLISLAIYMGSKIMLKIKIFFFFLGVRFYVNRWHGDSSLATWQACSTFSFLVWPDLKFSCLSAFCVSSAVFLKMHFIFCLKMASL